MEQHIRNSNNHHLCDACDRDFVSETALKQHHMNSSRHVYCTICEALIDDLDISLDEHNEKVHYVCPGCDEVSGTRLPTAVRLIGFLSNSQVFEDRRSMLTHCNKVHADRWCRSCERMFENENNLRQHLRSGVHQPANIPCPMEGCDRFCINPAALVLHYESGTCPSGLTRDSVIRLVAEYDKEDVITEYYSRCSCPETYGGCGKEYPLLSSLFQHMVYGQCGVNRSVGKLRRLIDGVVKGRFMD